MLGFVFFNANVALLTSYLQLSEQRRGVEIAKQQITEALVGRKLEHKRLLTASEQNTNGMVLRVPQNVQISSEVAHVQPKHKHVGKPMHHHN